MARLSRPKSSERMHYFRSRLRKASCMNDDDSCEDHSDDDLPPPHPSTSLSPSPGQEELIASSPSSLRTALSKIRPEDMNQQLQSAFFTSLPPEIRLESNQDEEDPMQMDSWPGWRGKNQPPRWFWHAWGLRLRWGAHWRCQADAMTAWKTSDDGTCVDERSLRRGNYMDVFLTCKKIYSEAVESFFESTTLIFTASEDAYRFFVQQPHAYQSKIHALDFSFTHFKDHLFLQPIASEHPRLAVGSNVPVSQDVWKPLMLCVREKLPELRRLRVHLSTSAPPERVEMFLEVLRTWVQDGYGKIEERDDGLVYVGEGMQQAGLRSDVEEQEP
ncbi:hypothetical protein VMCG_05207 [Cytospora schulzeri]|uniref:DUF7730 domain-containing protein n=1 Tax=Cytospora schulzeri TaxID=448051 RepID=A0A423WRE5_9PEZI|nr:hypothetical protein VMCG_05207 [Valsa malicola]